MLHSISKYTYQRILWNTSLLGKSLLGFVSPNVKFHNRYCHNWHNSVSSVIEFFQTSISLILGEAEGHVVLFETVVPICPPACDGYNYSSKGTSGLQVGMAFLFVPILTMLSLYIFNLKLKRWNNTQIEKRHIF